MFFLFNMIFAYGLQILALVAEVPALLFLAVIYTFAVLIHNKDSLLSNISDLHPMMKLFSQQQEVAKKVIEINIDVKEYQVRV